MAIVKAHISKSILPTYATFPRGQSHIVNIGAAMHDHTWHTVSDGSVVSGLLNVNIILCLLCSIYSSGGQYDNSVESSKEAREW